MVPEHMQAGVFSVQVCVASTSKCVQVMSKLYRQQLSEFTNCTAAIDLSWLHGLAGLGLRLPFIQAIFKGLK